MMERITQSMLANSSIYNVQANTNRMADINQSMTSGKRMAFPSDDPAGSVSSMRLRKELSATEQYQRNIDDAASWMSTSDAAMQSVSSNYQLAKNTLIRSINGAMGPEARRALASDLEQQAEALMKTSNSTYLGRTVFAGNSDKGTVFTKATGPGGTTVYRQSELDSVTSQDVLRKINANQEVVANVDGNKLFGTGSVKWDGDKINPDNNPNVMNLLVEAARLLKEPTLDNKKISAIQEEIDRRTGMLMEELSTVGARHKMVEEAQTTVVFDIQNVKSQISGVEDIDLQKATIEMSLAEMAYKASLSATQRVIQPSLLDYLR